MKQIRTSIFAIIFAASAILPLVSSAQERKKITVTNTVLQARLFSGDQTQWGMATDISSPHAVTFRWGSKQPGAVKAYYQVSEENLVFDTTPAAMQKAIAHGDLGQLPAADHVAQFDIDFAAFAPATPPAQPKTYFVRVITVDDKGHLVGAPSMSARVFYSAPNAPVNFNDATGKTRPDVPPSGKN